MSHQVPAGRERSSEHLLGKENTCTHTSPHVSEPHYKIAAHTKPLLQAVSAEERSRSLELAQLPTSLQDRAHAFSSTSCVLNLTQIRKSKDLPEQQGPRTGGPGVHRLDNCDLHSLTFILSSFANSPNFLSEPTFPSKHGILWPQ